MCRSEFYRHETRIARKEHECLECGDKISKGTSYEYHVGKNEYLWGAKLCLQCNKDWDTVLEAEAAAGIWDPLVCFGDLRDRINNRFMDDVFPEDHPLVLRWIPEEFLEESEDEEGKELVGKDNPFQAALF